MDVFSQKLHNELPDILISKMQEVTSVVEGETVDRFRASKAADSRLLLEQKAVFISRLLKVPKGTQPGESSS